MTITYKQNTYHYLLLSTFHTSFRQVNQNCNYQTFHLQLPCKFLLSTNHCFPKPVLYNPQPTNFLQPPSYTHLQLPASYSIANFQPTPYLPIHPKHTHKKFLKKKWLSLFLLLFLLLIVINYYCYHYFYYYFFLSLFLLLFLFVTIIIISYIFLFSLLFRIDYYTNTLLPTWDWIEYTDTLPKS